MTKALDMTNNNQKENVMSIPDVMGPFDRANLEMRPQKPHIHVEDYEDTATDEVGVFVEAPIADGKLSRALHISLHKDVLRADLPEFGEKKRNTVLNFCNTSDDVSSPNGIVEMNSGNFNLIPDMDFSMVVFTEDGVIRKELVLNTDDWELADWWPNKETGFDAVLVPKGERKNWNAIVQSGTKAEPITMDRAYKFIEKLHFIPTGFGSLEQTIRWITTTLGMHVAEILHMAGMFGMNVFQIKSEELIDMAVQADKAFKRKSTLFRVGTAVNEYIRGEEWVYRMVKAFDPETMDIKDYTLNPVFEEINKFRKDWEEEFTMDTLHNMNIRHHDGCIFVSPKHLAWMKGMINARYARQGYSEYKAMAARNKFSNALTYQIRISGNSFIVIDDEGKRISSKGHAKTHMMPATGALARWMDANDVAFFGTDDSWKSDMAVDIDGIALLVQTKAPKFDVRQSTQFFNTIDAVLQGKGYMTPLKLALIDKLDELTNMGPDELQKFAEQMAGEVEDDEDDEIGEVRRGFNELLALYGASKLPVIDSPAAFFAVFNNLLQKFRFATLNPEKNEDMSNKGNGRHIPFPIPGVRLQVFPRAFMVAGGYQMPSIVDQQVHFFGLKADKIQVAVIADETWNAFLDVTGYGDLDDFWEMMAYINQDGTLRVKGQRNPAMYGEYMLFDLHPDSTLAFHHQVVNQVKDMSRIPVINEALLPVPVNEVKVNGKHIEPITLEEAYNTYLLPIFGAPATKDDMLDAQKRLMRTYGQMIVVAGVALIERFHNMGQDHWKRMDSNLLKKVTKREVTEYNAAMAYWEQNGGRKPQEPLGVVQGAIVGFTKKINTEPGDPRYEDFHALLDPNVDPFMSMPPETDYGLWAAKKLAAISTAQNSVDKFKYEGGITLARGVLEGRCEMAFRRILERTYHEHGIKLTGEPFGMKYNRNLHGTTSQRRLRVLKRRDNFFGLFGSNQSWKFMRAHKRWLNSSSGNTRIVVQGLDDTRLGRIVKKTTVSNFVPAASAVRLVYSTLYNGKVDGRKDLSRPEIVKYSREAWLEALELVQVEVSNEVDVYKFIIALLYVLRVTPHVKVEKGGEFSIDKNLQEGYGKPGNVDAEQLLYSSIFMNWNEDRRNILYEAFMYMHTIPTIDVEEGTREFELVTWNGTDVYGDLFVFTPEDDQDVNTIVCQSCDIVYHAPAEVAETKWAEFRANKGLCKRCR